MAGLISPSKITAWLACDHTLTLDHNVATGTLHVEAGAFGEMAAMLMDKGQAHEDAVLARYESAGRRILRVSERRATENFQQWVDRVGNPMVDEPGDWDVIYQMPMIHDGIRGIADFLVRVDATETSPQHWEAVDAKLARQEAKPGHVLQLCFYADALEALTGSRGDHVHLELGSGGTESIRLTEVHPYWRRIRSDLARALRNAPTASTVAEPCSHCVFCSYAGVCDDEWRAADSLVFVAGLRAADRATLVEAEVPTLVALASVDPTRSKIDVTHLDRVVRQADLQVRTRGLGDEAAPLFEVLPLSTDIEEQIGYGALPKPDVGDVFLDFEGHPFWTPEAGLFFLFGLIERADTSSMSGSSVGDDDWTFVSFWAHDEADERDATAALIDHLDQRRAAHPDMHVYHYNHTERSSLQRLTSHHGVAELRLESMVADGLFVDLFAVVRGAVQIGAESYGLKHVERLTGFERGHDIDAGSGAVVEYERWMQERDESLRQPMLDRIASYNEDDVRATRAVRDWLVEHRPADAEWRAARLDFEENEPELDARIEALHRFDVGSPEHLLGDILGYYRRERRVLNADVMVRSAMGLADQLGDRNIVAGLQFVGMEDQFGSKGKKLKWQLAEFTFPEQRIDSGFDSHSPPSTVFVRNATQWGFPGKPEFDRAARSIKLTWNQKCQDTGIMPSALIAYDSFNMDAKVDALNVLADEILAGAPSPRAAWQLLRRELPNVSETVPPFVADVNSIRSWVTTLDHQCVPVQGPPGTGKTYTGAHIVKELVKAGKRVGITSMSHSAIDNLMSAVVDRFTEDGELDALRAVRKATSGPVENITYLNDNPKAASPDFDVVGGTTWLFAANVMRENPVDVLIIDEAGQLSLTDALAASISADSVILLGDPQQLPQVAQASHPHGSGASCLEHLLGDAAVVEPDRGVFLETTRRMHPDVNGFISDVMYDGGLGVHSSCEGQNIDRFGTGLRWMRVDHMGNDTSSVEEAEAIFERVRSMMNADWTDQNGETTNLRPKDFMVVAAYNDQVNTIRSVFAQHKRTAKVEVGTVDKFQGREAAVVFYSMASSSAALMPRGVEFLFSRNRLNVAISRARCLAHLVCTDALLSTRARTVDEMKMIGALNALVARSETIRQSP